MATITLGGMDILTSGMLPEVGSPAPDFVLTDEDMHEVSLEDYLGKTIVMNIFPSIDTAVSAESTRRFNAVANARDDIIVLCISADLPFAQARFCNAEKLHDVEMLSTFRHPEFGERYGVRIEAGRLAGLMTRAVVVIDETGSVAHRELVDEVGKEPDYDAALRPI